MKKYGWIDAKVAHEALGIAESHREQLVEQRDALTLQIAEADGRIRALKQMRDSAGELPGCQVCLDEATRCTSDHK